MWSGTFHYRDDGALIWLNVNRNRKSKNGSVAGTKSRSTGYLYVKVNQEMFSCHRVVWEMHNGEIPAGMEIDHINHVRTDNRIENLRLTSKQGNAMNRSMTSRNTSGFVGVSWCKIRKKWLAFIKVDGVMINLGRYSDLNLAVRARKDAELKYGFHKNHGM